MAVNAQATQAIRNLRDLVEALDRRVPHVERAGEALIVQDAAALKAKALKRIAELENPSSDSEPSAPAGRRKVNAD